MEVQGRTCKYIYNIRPHTMSLNWRFTDEARFNSMSDADKEWNDAYVWGCMAVDMRDITDKNAEEWCKRYELYNKLLGAMYYRGENGEPYIPTLEEVRKRIGLTTNVGTKTRAQFLKKVMTRFFSEPR